MHVCKGDASGKLEPVPRHGWLRLRCSPPFVVRHPGISAMDAAASKGPPHWPQPALNLLAWCIQRSCYT